MEILSPVTDATALSGRILRMIEAGHTGAARPLLAALRRLVPPSPALAQMAARLAMDEGRMELAQDELDRAIALDPAHGGLLRYRAELRRMAGDLSGALHDAAEAVLQEPQDARGKALLGSLLTLLGSTADAVRCLRDALHGAPADAAIYEALAQAELADGDPIGAEATLAAGMRALPGRISLRNAAILLAVRRGNFAAALAEAEAARAMGLVDACLLGLQAHALSSLGRHAEASLIYAEALKLGPDDPYVRHLVAAAGLVAEEGRAHAEYVRTVFDGYADRFEPHLIALGYRVPGLIRQAVQRHLPASPGATLDLGCGSGLLGVALSDLGCAPLVGVDLSPRMLAQAAAKGLYGELHEADLERLLAEDERHWQLILAGDVLCYFGALEGLLRAVRSRLAHGGCFVFTAETLTADAPPARGWALGRAGRYAHRPDYIRRAAAEAGLLLRDLSHEALRNEQESPVAGMLVVLERPRDDH